VKVLSVVGARPQFVKLAPIAHEFSRQDIEHIIVHTGQHYDPMLSDVFFHDLEIPAADEHLGVGSAGHGRQTGEMLALLDDVLVKHRPDWVLTYGDTNSTLAGALSAAKLHFPIAHLEAGLRSFNRRMPEEINRIVTDHVSDLCLAPTGTALTQLDSEGLGSVSVNVGDVMVDVLLRVRDSVLSNRVNPFPDLEPGTFFVSTLHRAENTDDRQRLEGIIDALASIECPVVLLAHPRLKTRASEYGIRLDRGNLRVESPLSYPDLIATVMASAGVITDSGGLQKEAFVLRIPCTTVRGETEWTETVETGWNTLATTAEAIVAAATRAHPPDTPLTPYGSGNAAARVRQALTNRRPDNRGT